MSPSRNPLRLVLALSTILIAGCPDADRPSSDADGRRPLVLLLSPAHDPGRAAVSRLGVLLQKELARPVEIRVAPTHDAAVSMAGTPHVDVALLPLFEYLFSRQEYGAEATLRVIRHGDRRTYKGEIVVRADSELKALQDLEGKPVAFVDEHSVSGFLLPAKTLREADVGVVPVLAGTHEAALDALRKQEVVAAAVHAGMAGPDLRVLAGTGEVPNEPVFFRGGLDPELRRRTRDALVELSNTSEGKRILHDVAEISGFEDAADAEYEDVSTAIGAAGKRIQDLVPSGWRLHHTNRDNTLLLH